MTPSERVLRYLKRVVWPGVVAASVILAFWPALIDDKALSQVQRARIGLLTFVVCVSIIGIARALARRGFVRRAVSSDQAAESIFRESPGEHLASEANKCARKTFGRFTISYDAYKKWREKNPKIFVAMIGPDDRLFGYFDVFPLTDNMGELICQGQREERDISIDDILSLQEVHACCYVYIASIECCVASEIAEFRLEACLAQYIFKLYPPKRNRVYLAFGATPDGRRLLKRNGFRLSQDKRTGVSEQSLRILGYDDALRVMQRFEVCEQRVQKRRSGLRQQTPVEMSAES